MIREVRYKRCIDKAIDFIFEYGINSFPFDCDDIIKKNKWAKLKYSELAKSKNVTIKDISETFGDDGYTIFNGRNYTIAYNDKKTYREEPKPKRIYFTKLHEIGHIYLKHFLEFDETIINRSNLSNAQYDILEKEADTFAGFIIAPPVIVKHLGMSNYEVSSYFGITSTAAETRISYLKKDYRYLTKEKEQQLLNFFGKSIYKRTCLNCKSKFTSKNAKYCPICGEKYRLWGDGEMKYKGIETDNKKKAIICPICENDEILEGAFCPICGTNLFNRCSNELCGISLDGNARFCHQCGSSSTFFAKGILKEWNYIEPAFIDDGDMPF